VNALVEVAQTMSSLVPT